LGPVTCVPKRTLVLVNHKERIRGRGISHETAGETRTGADNSKDRVGFRNQPLLSRVTDNTATCLSDCLPEYLGAGSMKTERSCGSKCI
jgi:hypothetical protein